MPPVAGERARRLAGLALAAGLAGLATPAAAYLGPGAGIGAVGTLIAVVFAGLLLIVGFLWYPLRRLLRRRKKGRDAGQGGQDGPGAA
ncbi:hypothetical protein [Paralimibaculum aggregatum]|uniref:hypothetical protein n=1 Tax=Paralimibaculum aggregatum TaxID=3036245 RepID=UPI0025562B2F|nr:hypothetical protein [Limibaculum sp. NKW23]